MSFHVPVTRRIRSAGFGLAAALVATSCSGGGGSNYSRGQCTEHCDVRAGRKFRRDVRSEYDALGTVATGASAGANDAGMAGSTQSPAPQNSPASASGPVTVNLHYQLSAQDKASTQSVGAQSQGGRRLQYISASNSTITVVVTPVGGSGTSYGPNMCTTVTCNIIFTANPGPNVIAFTLKSGGGNVLSTYSTTQIVQPNVENMFNLTANPVVNSATVSLAAPSINAGAAANDVLTLNALDQNGNIIVGSAPYVDANNNPVSLKLATQNIQNGGTGSVSILGPSRVSSASHPAINAQYNGGWLASTNISIVPSETLPGGVTNATLTTVPTIYEVASGFNQPHNIIKGPDGNLWFSTSAGNQIVRITTSGASTIYPLAYSAPAYLTVGPDGAIWFPFQLNNEIGRITSSGSLSYYAPSAPNELSITTGPDGNLWMTTNLGNGILRMTPSGSSIAFTSGIPGGSALGDIASGSDGNLWFTDRNNNQIGRITPLGSVTQFPGVTCGGDWGIIAGPDGNMWFAERTGNCIGKISMSGVIANYSAGLSGGADPVNLTVGPDGAIWFGEDGGGKIGRITTGGTITEYGNGISAGSSPQDVTLGPDGNIWFAEFNGGRIGKLVF